MRQMAEDRLLLSDVSLSDGQTACWQSSLTTAMTTRLAARLGQADLSALEVMTPEIFAACLQRGENPWHRIEDIRAHAPAAKLRTVVNPLTAHGRGSFDVLGNGDLRDWITRLADCGIDEVLVIDPLRDDRRLKLIAKAIAKSGMEAIAVLNASCPLEDLLVEAQWLVSKAGYKRLQLRDEAGLLVADELPKLLTGINGATGGTRLGLHLRCNSGLGPQTAFEALKFGVRELDVALPTLANGPSLPSSINLARGCNAVGVNVDVDSLSMLTDAECWLAEMAAREGLPLSDPWNFDVAPFIHKLPGADAAFAAKELRQRGQLNRLHDFAHECARIQKEVGNIPPQYPFARAIAQQAIWHLDDQPQRWQRVHPILKRAIQGHYGKLPISPASALIQRFGVINAATIPAVGCSVPLANRIGGTGSKNPIHAEYDEARPDEALARGLIKHLRLADGFAHVDVLGPDLHIAMGAGKDAGQKDV
jgi:oxaloacetate decarboxylase alpha subunit